MIEELKFCLQCKYCVKSTMLDGYCNNEASERFSKKVSYFNYGGIFEAETGYHACKLFKDYREVENEDNWED